VDDAGNPVPSYNANVPPNLTVSSPAQDSSILAMIAASQGNTDGSHQNPLFDKLTYSEAAARKALSKEVWASIMATPLKDSTTPIRDFREWRRQFPCAVALRLSPHADLDDFVAFANTEWDVNDFVTFPGEPHFPFEPQSITLKSEPEPIGPIYMKGIRIFDVSSSQLSGRRLTLFGAFPHMRALMWLTLNRNDMGDAGATALAAVLPALTKLTWLTLDHNNIGPAGTRALAAVLPALTELVSLDLDFNHLGNEGATALAAALPSLTRLTTLQLRDNYIDNEGATALVAALPALTKLTILDLSRNNIGKNGAIALAAALPALTELTVLDLDKNTIGTAGATALAAVLPALPKVEALHLNQNNIGNVGVGALAAALPALTKLRVLDVGYNMIGDIGVIALAAALPRTLTDLSLYNTEFGDPGATALAAALPALTELKVLDLRYNKIYLRGSGCAALNAAYSTMPALKTVHYQPQSR
jgi:Ran GTPase-activating protein (RanGAP) involved in mRNA processing and transport